MKFKEALEYLNDLKKEDGSYIEDELVSLIIDAYDSGYRQSIEDSKEEDYSTEEREFNKSR